MSDMIIPCKNCICLPICKSKYKEQFDINFNISSDNLPIIKSLEIRILANQCSLLKQYLLLDKYTTPNSRIIRWFIKLIINYRGEKVHKNMMRNYHE